MNIINLLKGYKQLLLLFYLGVLFSSCEREMINEIISITPPELHVIVHQGTDKTIRVAGATVTLYATDADRTANTNSISTSVTNGKGEAIFTEKDFKKGELFIMVSKDATTVNAKTPYLLQNDGKTVFWVAI
jgi:hypothetical protein